MPENKNSSGYTYKTPPTGVSNVKRVEFYFNETPYAQYFGSTVYSATDPVAYGTVILFPGGSKSINQSRCTWKMGVADDGRPYMYTASSSGGSNVYWNIALTFYM